MCVCAFSNDIRLILKIFSLHGRKIFAIQCLDIKLNYRFGGEKIVYKERPRNKRIKIRSREEKQIATTKIFFFWNVYPTLIQPLLDGNSYLNKLQYAKKITGNWPKWNWNFLLLFLENTNHRMFHRRIKRKIRSVWWSGCYRHNIHHNKPCMYKITKQNLWHFHFSWFI